MAASELSTALVKRSGDDVALMPPPPIKKIKRPPKVLDEDKYTDALSDIIARDYFPGLRESRAQQEYLAALDSNNDGWVAEAAQKLRDATKPDQKTRTQRQTRDPRYDTPSATPQPKRASDTPVGHDGSETPISTIFTLGRQSQSEQQEVDTSMLSLSNFQSIYTSEDNASFNDVVDKQNATRRKKHAHLWTPDQRIPSKRLLLHRAKEQQLLTQEANNTSLAKSETLQLIPLTTGATDSRPAKPDSWKTKSPTNNLMFHASSSSSSSSFSEDTSLPTQLEERERGSKAGPKRVIHENTRFPPLQYLDEYEPNRGIPQSPSLNTDIITNRRKAAVASSTVADYAGGDDTPRVNGYAYVDDEDEPDHIPTQPIGPSYRDMLAGQVGDGDDATPNPFKLSASLRREALHHRLVEDTNRKKRAKELETTKKPGLVATPGGAGMPGMEPVGNMTPAARKLMVKLGQTPVRQTVKTPSAAEMWTPVAKTQTQTPRRVAKS